MSPFLNMLASKLIGPTRHAVVPTLVACAPFGCVIRVPVGFV